MHSNPVIPDRPPHAPPDARVYVIDDLIEMRKSLHLQLDSVGITTWPFASPFDFLDQFDTLPPAPILLDIRMAELDGVGVMSELASRRCVSPVIVMTAHADIAVAVQLMKLGAIEFLEKPFCFDDLVGAIDRAFEMLATTSASNSAAIDAQRRVASLTPREAEVVAGLLTGAPNKVVAAGLGLSTRTVEMHRAHGFQKLGTRNMVETVALAQCANWTGPEAHDI